MSTDRTYDQVALSTRTITSLAWARAYARFLIRDTPNEVGAYPQNSLTDIELDQQLTSFSVIDRVTGGGDDTVYYRPHVVATHVLTADPTRLMAFSVSGYAETAPDLAIVTRGILLASRWVDAAIETATNGRLSFGIMTLRS